MCIRDRIGQGWTILDDSELAGNTYYADADNDGFGDANMTRDTCALTPPAGYVTNADDCDDTNDQIHPNATEICDGINNNCDGQIDEGFVVPAISTSGQPKICYGESFDLATINLVDANNTGAIISYHTDSPADGNNSLTNTLVSPSDTADYYILATTNDGCKNELKVTVIVVPEIDILLTPQNPTTICTGDNYDLGSFNLSGTSSLMAISYHSGTPTTVSNQISNQLVTPTTDSTFYYRLEDFDGCVLEIPLGITVNPATHVDCSSCPGTIIYVNSQATSGTNEGSSWADAFINLQSAIDLIVDGSCPAGTEIRVASGTYKPTKERNSGDPRSKTFYIDTDMKLYGGYNPNGDGTRDFTTYPTILSGDLDNNDVPNQITDPETCITLFGDNSYNVLFINEVSSNFQIDGFIIASGWNNSNSLFKNGGGLVNNGNGRVSQPTLSNCWFTSNQAGFLGGAIYNDGRNGGNASMTLINCNFYCNQAVGGGAIFEDTGNGIISSTVSSCKFLKNQTSNQGGAILSSASDGNYTSTFTNCLFAENSAANYGAAIYNFNDTNRPNGKCEPEYSFCTISNNTAGVGGIGGAIYNNFATPIVQNSILWGNCMDANGLFKEQIVDIANGQIISKYNLIQNGYIVPPPANFPEELENAPLFADPSQGDYSLLSCSPAIDKGNEQVTPTEDIAGNIRPTNAAYDWGAYEYTGSPCNTNIVYVNETATGNNDGTSWADAYIDLQTAIETAKNQTKEEIWIAEGVYYPTKERDWTKPSTPTNQNNTFYIDFDVKIYGGFPNSGNPNMGDRDWDIHRAILSGDIDLNDDNSDGNYIAENLSLIHI